MNPPLPDDASGLDTQPLRALLDECAEHLAQVLEAMAGQRPEVRWQAVAAGATPEEEVLWWEQPLQFAPEACIWVGSPRATWEHAATLSLQASGLETVPEGEAQKTWLEILSQWLAAVARSLGSTLGREVTCAAGSETAPATPPSGSAAYTLAFGETTLAPLSVAFSAPLLALLASPPVDETHEGTGVESDPAELALDAGRLPAASRTMDLLLDVDLPVSISFGKTQLALKDVLKLTTGSIVELNRGVSDPVDVLVNHCLVARGEVVVVEGNYGVRIQQIVSRPERLRSLR